jgi:peptidoglycan/LPS O-acetylase OafA/YrhL
MMQIPIRNNFDFLRFSLALTVCLVHASILADNPELAVISDFLSSEVAVQGFFAISGFLIFMSYERSKSLKSFAMKRVLRLFPAYVTVIVLSALLLRSLSSSDAYYFTYEWWAYLAANLVYLNFLQPELPGVFQGNVIPAVNGALWTLKVEIAFYLVVPAFVWAIRLWGPMFVLIAAYLISSVYANYVSGPLKHQLPGELRYFMAGAACYYGWPLLQRHIKLIPAICLVIIYAGKVLPISFIVPAAVGILVISAGFFCYLGNFGRYGDFSYGIYILHFPVIQTLTQLGVFKASPWLGLLMATTLTLIGAVLMWNFIESRFLQSHGRYSSTSKN